MGYSQNDQRWKNTILGFNTGASDTLGNYGCYVTAIADVCKWAGNDLTPAQINDICKEHNWFVNGGLISRDDIPSLLCNNLQFAGRTNWNDAVSMNFFADASSLDVAYIICIDANKAAGIQTHFVMVWAKLGENDLQIDDSWDGVRKALSHYGSPPVIIQSAVKFVKTHPAPPPPPPPAAPEPQPTPVVEVVLPPSPPPSPVDIAPPVAAGNTEQYSLIKEIPYYPSPGNAFNRTNSKGNLINGAYYIFNKQQGMYSLTKTLNQSQGTWINPADNVLPVVPEVGRFDSADTIKASFRWFFPTHEPVEYKVLKDVIVKDCLHSGTPITIHKGHAIDIYGSFDKDGMTYLRPFTATDLATQYYFYGIPTTDIYTGAPYMDNEFDTMDIVSAKWESIYDKIVRFFRGLVNVIKRK